MSALDVKGRELSDGSVLFGKPVRAGDAWPTYDAQAAWTTLPLPNPNNTRSSRRTDRETLNRVRAKRRAANRQPPWIRIVIVP